MRINRRTTVTGLLATMSGVPGLVHPVRAPALEPLGVHESVMLRICGDDAASTTIIPRIAANLLAIRGAGDIEIIPAAPPWTTQVRGRVLPDTEVSILIQAATTIEGYEWLAAGKADVWVAARHATQAEMEGLKAVGTPAFTRFARFPLVVAVHPDNPVQTLSHEQVRDIYTGEVTDWQEVGGTPGPIHVYGRGVGTANAGTFTGFFYGADASSVVRHLPLFTDIQRTLAGDHQGIGYLAASYAGELKQVVLTIDDRVTSLPDAYGLETEDYPLANALYLYRVEKPGMDIAEAFVREAMSPRSEYLMTRFGLRAAGPRLLWPQEHVPLPARTDIGEFTLNAVRVNITIHFPGDSDELDSAARQDISVLVRYLRRLSVPTSGLVHACYSEDSGDAAVNRATSLRLGEIFAAALDEENFVAGQLVPFGAALRLAEDDTPAGRRANRRVETWIRP